MCSALHITLKHYRYLVLPWTRKKLHHISSIHFFYTSVYWSCMYAAEYVDRGIPNQRGAHTGLCPPCSWLVPFVGDWLHQDLIGFSFGSPVFILCFYCHKKKVGEKERDWMFFLVWSLWNNFRTVQQPSRAVFWKYKDMTVLHTVGYVLALEGAKSPGIALKAKGCKIWGDLIHTSYLRWVT